MVILYIFSALFNIIEKNSKEATNILIITMIISRILFLKIRYHNFPKMGKAIEKKLKYNF